MQPHVAIAKLNVESAGGIFTIGRDAFPQFSFFKRLGVHVQSDQVRVANPDPTYVETALRVLAEACLQLDVPEAYISFVDTVIAPPAYGLRYGFKGAFTTDEPKVIWVFANWTTLEELRGTVRHEAAHLAFARTHTAEESAGHSGPSEDFALAFEKQADSLDRGARVRPRSQSERDAGETPDGHLGGMRKKAYGTVRVRAIAGTYVVFLAFDMKEPDAHGLMGFAIQRTRLSDGETIWLRGNKRFPSVTPPTGFEDASSHEHPFQAFQWADYSAEPGNQYRYRVIPMFGNAGALTDGPATSVTIETEPLVGTSHDVHWNRGAIASQAFVRRFPGMTLDQAGAPAYEWLTRDLLPALLAFIAQANDASYSLRAAIYEFQWPAVLDAFRAAHQAGADVQIVYHAKADDTGPANDAAIAAAQIKSLCIPRRNAKLMHDKFIVLSRNGAPVSLWTGSTNVSRNALFGQLNVGHAIHDPVIAQSFLDYWDELRVDPAPEALKDRVEAINPSPSGPGTDPITPIFSPRHGRGVFDWWIEQAGRPKPLFMTFPFGIVKDFRPVFDKDDGILRFALLDKYVNGGNAASRAAAIADIERIRSHKNIGMAIGNRIFVDWIDGWHEEQDGIGVNVNWIHTKFMLIDPLGSKPVTLSGSANWSEASVTDNDENMLVIRGDKRVADIYFGEFMRLFAHHRFRESVKRHLAEIASATPESWRPKDLFEDWTKWVPTHFTPGSEHDITRRYFAGS